MPITLGSNIAALRALRGVAQSSEAISRVFERLASGMRINRASDDPAGQALAASVQTEARILAQGYRNISDGISFLNIAGSALEQLNDILARMSELATQSANGTYSASQRSALDAEFQALHSEYSRIVESTEYNGITIFDANNRSLQIQAGHSAIELTPVEGLLREVGTGVFTPLAGISTSVAPYGIVSGDLNADGEADLVIGTQGTSLQVLLSNGNGTFKAGVVYTTGNKANSLNLFTGDVNGDGATDLISSDFYDNSVSVLIGNGNGTFKAKVATTGLTGASRVASGDFNGDGQLDLAVRATNSNPQILLGNGNGTFTWGPSVPIYLSTTGAYISALDINRDGTIDLLSSDGATAPQVVLGNGNGTFRAAVSYVISAGSGFQPMFAADLNNDGVVDLGGELTAGSGGVAVFLGNSDGSFKASVSYFGPLPGTTYRNILAVDFNEDGAADIVYNTSSSLVVLLNNGNGTFESAATYAGGGDIRALAVGDFDSDGATDLVSANGSNFSFTVMLNNTSLATSLATMDISTSAAALSSIESLTSARTRVLAQIGINGAQESRLTFAAHHLSSMRDVLLATSARITDADIAADVAELVRLQILQKAALGAMAHANLNTRAVLALLDS